MLKKIDKRTAEQELILSFAHHVHDHRPYLGPNLTSVCLLWNIRKGRTADNHALISTSTV